MVQTFQLIIEIPLLLSAFGGRYPSYAGRAVSQVLSWRRHSCSHSCISMRNCRGFPQLQFITIVVTPFVAQMLIRMVFATMENPQLRVDRAVDAPVMQVVQFMSSSKAPCIWQSLVRCSVFAVGVQVMEFSGRSLQIVFRMLHSLIRQRIHVSRQSTRPFGRISHVLDPRFSALCLVRQRIHAHASDYGGSRVEATLAVACARLVQFSSADVEETVELPRLHSLWISSCGAAHHRVDELMG